MVEILLPLLFLSMELFKFEIQKCGQILRAHKPFSHAGSHIMVDTNTFQGTF